MGCSAHDRWSLDRLRARGIRFALGGIRQRDEALDMLDADQVRQKRHQLEGLGELAVAHGLSRLDVRLELEHLLFCDF